jgi:ankyrin repeat protein
MWLNSYKFYNRSPPNINVDPETLYNIFKGITYENPSNPCSDVIGDWTRHLKYITYAMTKYLTDEELFYVPKPALLDLLLNKINKTSAMGSQLITRVYDLAQKIGIKEVTNAIDNSRGIKLAPLMSKPPPGRPPLSKMPSQARRGIAFATPVPAPAPVQPIGQYVRLGQSLPPLGQSLPPLGSQPQSDESLLLSLAASGRDIPQMKHQIAQQGINLAYADEAGRNILHFLANYESAEILDLVFAKNSSPEFINAEDKFRVSPLAITLKKKLYTNAASFLNIPNIDVFHKDSYEQNSILKHLILNVQTELVRKVFTINNSAEFVNYEDSTDMSPISYALEAENQEIISLILTQPNFKASKNILYSLDGVKTPRILTQLLSVVELYEPDYVNYVDPASGNTPLIAACKKGNLILVKALLKSPFVLTAVRNLRGETALHAAAEFCRDNYAPNLKEEELFELAGGQIIRLLLDRNSVLANIPSQSGIKPAGEEYSGPGPLKKFLKMQKSTVFKKHRNTNINTRKAINDHAKNPLKMYKNPLAGQPGGRKTRRARRM